jgi:hypothetical protein
MLGRVDGAFRAIWLVAHDQLWISLHYSPPDQNKCRPVLFLLETRKCFVERHCRSAKHKGSHKVWFNNVQRQLLKLFLMNKITKSLQRLFCSASWWIYMHFHFHLCELLINLFVARPKISDVQYFFLKGHMTPKFLLSHLKELLTFFFPFFVLEIFRFVEYAKYPLSTSHICIIS